jgi:MoaA/NifB/PqqE/SkfB family radical SAM enzyme
MIGVERGDRRVAAARPWVAFDVELTNRCNIVCTMCPRDQLKRPFGMMAQPTFDRLLAELEEVQRHRSIRVVSLTGFGDSLLHPDVAGYVAALRRRLSVFVVLTTNGVSLTPELCRALDEAGLDRLNLSVHTLPHNHDRIVRGVSFDEVLARVRLAVSMMPSKVAINCVDMPINAADQAAFRRFWEAEGVRSFESYRVHTRGGQLRDEGLVPLRKLPEGCNIFLPLQFVAWNGDLLSCCSDLSGATRLGSVLTDELEAVLEHKEALKNPRLHFDYCKRCPDEFPAEKIAR